VLWTAQAGYARGLWVLLVVSVLAAAALWGAQRIALSTGSAPASA
jgi:hypothetical protein